MDIEKEREAFEAWFESRYDAHFMQFALDLDFYVDKHTQTCWKAWQAAKAQAVPDGFMVVPKEPTDEILKVANKILIAAYELRISNNQCLKRIYQAMIEAQEPIND